MTILDLIEVSGDGYTTDVCDNYTEELFIAYCGEKLTEEGKKHFAEALSLPIEKLLNELVVIAVDQKGLATEQIEHRLEIAKDFFESLAGYCDADDYEKWVIL